ncbi:MULTISPECIES: sugar 3,4-ketoisomerase [Proteus]|uniref:sugar 3,4-ketoisomerase n=1 Tax=Proteus TaxID=583 RepID=UPI00138FEDD0|nr:MULTISPECIES: FdtA/QdtA family cupin domain-containing protein [Proteus]ELN4247226.1 FdtA/QdtA family cupin domain-containing protein [Proteus mirabilis]ELN4571115.1 FdtA/QdtA family cupin domain-containing protein [Proteus mirabilis]MBI6296402.1 FdtA/QdtA family cupin domain-containing protein [Proteus mirabilis]MDM3586033.1 FdtA/QdtA family cupin domain-containing protein [Proteus mirabilis]MDM3831667.1 FdtA/QdtA family cupin domain-containing protein [Proteus mirabilis]
MNNLIKTIEFKTLGDKRGSLISLESNHNIPFNIKRTYYIFNTEKNVSRGFHAHKKLKQLAICLKGSCDFIMDDGKEKEKITLNSPNIGLIIDPMQWHEMHNFSEDCIVLVLADNVYDESDYIRDYDTFQKSITTK